MPGTRYTLEVQPHIPQRLNGLAELSDDLLYSWDREVRALFAQLDNTLWEASGHNPKLFLRRVSQQRLENAVQDRIFMENYHRAMSSYNSYHREEHNANISQFLDAKTDLVAYFCAEFGFHESLPIYSGGLGILAGDHCKAASDLGVPFIAVGLLYRQGYFTQTIDGQGAQIAHYTPTNFANLPILPAQDKQGNAVYVHVELPGRSVRLKVWQAKAGHITLYLLDCDLPENTEHDRTITYHLYGGNIETRIQQEIILGIGGVRALRALELRPTVWHINEGHSAFQILERCRERVQRGWDFDSALECIAAGTVFTTHTPVPAGHDIFDHQLIITYFKNYVEHIKVPLDDFLQLGSSPGSQGGFNMTALALRGSRFHNGVSRIHGSMASHMEGYIWPQVPHDENPIGYVTNGVHVPTFLAREWSNLFDMHFGGKWRGELRNPDFWQHIDGIPNHSYWSLRQSLKSQLMDNVRRRTLVQYRRNGCSAMQIERLTRHLEPDNIDTLVLGFARRFATYKRATLLFSDPARLARILNDPQRPVMLIFAGKAHPRDLPGQQLIQTIHSLSRRPEFEGRILMLEGYDLALARKLVSGVDVWLNTPEYPLEASGTSGQKAGLNGVINLSVLDGWWGEGYNGENGWAITPHGSNYNAPHGASYDATHRDREEAQELLDLLEKEVVPLYYQRNGHGYSEGWVKLSKASMKSIMPQFNSQRMVMDYVARYYAPANQRCKILSANNGAAATQLSAWKKKVAQAWPQVRITRIDEVIQEIKTGDCLSIRASALLGGLGADDVCVECLLGTTSDTGEFTVHERQPLLATQRGSGGEIHFELDLCPTLSGLQHYKLRIYPYNKLLAHPFETGCMLWF
jgi:starch phosphorylase